MGSSLRPKRPILRDLVSVLGQLVTQNNPAWSVHAKGVQVRAARLKGQLDFTAAEIRFPLGFTGCYLDEAIIMNDASARSIILTGSHLFGIQANHLTVDGSVFLDEGFKAKGEVNLVGANIDGQLACWGGTFENALNADILKASNVFLNEGFEAKGDVNLVGAKIDGQLDCGGGTFENGLNATALKASSVLPTRASNGAGRAAKTPTKSSLRLYRSLRWTKRLLSAGAVRESCHAAFAWSERQAPSSKISRRPTLCGLNSRIERYAAKYAALSMVTALCGVAESNSRAVRLHPSSCLDVAFSITLDRRPSTSRPVS
jgi:hypothetical protein